MATSKKYTCKSWEAYSKKIAELDAKIANGDHSYETLKAYVTYCINQIKYQIEGCVAANPEKQYLWDSMANVFKPLLEYRERQMEYVENTYGPKNLFSYAV